MGRGKMQIEEGSSSWWGRGTAQVEGEAQMGQGSDGSRLRCIVGLSSNLNRNVSELFSFLYITGACFIVQSTISTHYLNKKSFPDQKALKTL